MSSILYYSNYCEHSKELLQYLTKQNFSSIKYLCIDKRYTSGNIYVILESQQPIILPKMITSVPALLVMDDGNKILFGKEFINILNQNKYL